MRVSPFRAVVVRGALAGAKAVAEVRRVARMVSFMVVDMVTGYVPEDAIRVYSFVAERLLAKLNCVTKDLLSGGWRLELPHL